MYLLAVHYILTINENSGVVMIGVPNQDNMRYVSPVWRYVSHHFALIQAVQIGTMRYVSPGRRYVSHHFALNQVESMP